MSLTRMRQKMRFAIRPLMWVIAAIFVIGCFTFYGNYDTAGGAASGPVNFARINGEEVPTAAFAAVLDREREMLRSFSSMGQAMTLEQQVDLPRRAFERLRDEYAQAAAAEANGVRVSHGEARAEMSRLVDARVEQLGEGSSDKEKKEIRRALMAGLDVEGQRRQMLAQRLRDKLTKEVRPVEVRVAHILIKTDQRTDEVARKKAEELAAQAKAGADFAKLAKENSEDPGSKENGGVVGWASAMPPTAPADPSAKPNPDDATSFVPEFTAAALRLRPNEVSGPVRTQYGYHVLKALAEREYQPKDAAAAKDEKKKTEAIDAYKSAAASQIAEGLFSEYRTKVRVEAFSPWLRGFLAEEQANAAISSDPKQTAQKLAPALTAYEEAIQKNDPAAGPALAFHLAQLYQRTDQDQKALDLLEKWAQRSGDADMYFIKGETLERMKRKTDALEAYQQAYKRAYNNPSVLMRLTEKFKTLGRADLAKEAEKKQGEQLQRQALARQRQEEAFRRMMQEQAAQEKAAQSSGGEQAEGEVVSEVTVKTGDVDPKTGKPKIVSVEQKGAGEKAKQPAAE